MLTQITIVEHIKHNKIMTIEIHDISTDGSAHLVKFSNMDYMADKELIFSNDEIKQLSLSLVCR